MLNGIARRGLKVEQILSYTHEGNFAVCFIGFVQQLCSVREYRILKLHPLGRAVERNVHQRDFLQDA